jgi:hypothetical protein
MRTDIKSKYEPTDDAIGNFQEEETVWLDKGFCGQSLVTIVRFHGEMYCTVKDECGNKWTVMIYRLSKP